jgi:hypothetical protein
MRAVRVFNKCKCGKLSTVKQKPCSWFRCDKCKEMQSAKHEVFALKEEKKFLKWMAKHHAKFIDPLIYAKSCWGDSYWVKETDIEFNGMWWVRGKVMPNGFIHRQFHTFGSTPGFSSRFRKMYERFVNDRKESYRQLVADKERSEFYAMLEKRLDEHNKRKFLSERRLGHGSKQFFQSIGMAEQIRRAS